LFCYKVIKEGIYSKYLGAGFERVEKITLARSNGQDFAERGH
jgi:L-ribulose-5-phosphate 3-epimerase UlaE